MQYLSWMLLGLAVVGDFRLLGKNVTTTSGKVEKSTQLTELVLCSYSRFS